MSSMKMRVCLEGMLDNAIKNLNHTQRDYYGFVLREMYSHLLQVAENPAIWPEFAAHYCLPLPEAKKDDASE